MRLSDIKYCKKCKQAFDIATNFDFCPECRIKELEEWEQEELKRLKNGVKK